MEMMILWMDKLDFENVDENNDGKCCDHCCRFATKKTIFICSRISFFFCKFRSNFKLISYSI